MTFNPADYSPEVPFLPGERVCLNPETPNYQEYNRRQADGTAGYVIKLELNESGLKRWRTFDRRDRAQAVCHVRWDNGNTNSYKFFDLLPVNTPAIDIIVLKLANGATLRGPTEYVFGEADFYVIKERTTVVSMERFDAPYRAKMLDFIGFLPSAP